MRATCNGPRPRSGSPGRIRVDTGVTVPGLADGSDVDTAADRVAAVSIAVGLIAVLALVLANAVFVAAEFSLVAVTAARSRSRSRRV